MDSSSQPKITGHKHELANMRHMFIHPPPRGGGAGGVLEGVYSKQCNCGGSEVSKSVVITASVRGGGGGALLFEKRNPVAMTTCHSECPACHSTVSHADECSVVHFFLRLVFV